MKIWRLDDGVMHLVFAESEEDAKAVVVEQYGPEDTSKAWPVSGWPEVTELSHGEAEKLTVREEDGRRQTLLEVFEAGPTRAYVACSEW